MLLPLRSLLPERCLLLPGGGVEREADSGSAGAKNKSLTVPLYSVSACRPVGSRKRRQRAHLKLRIPFSLPFSLSASALSSPPSVRCISSEPPRGVPLAESSPAWSALLRAFLA